MLTFMSLTHAPSTPLSVLVARATASLMASSKLVSDIALNSVTRAMLTVSASLNPGSLLVSPICSLAGRISNIRVWTLPLEGVWPQFMIQDFSLLSGPGDRGRRRRRRGPRRRARRTRDRPGRPRNEPAGGRPVGTRRLPFAVGGVGDRGRVQGRDRRRDRGLPASGDDLSDRRSTAA